MIKAYAKQMNPAYQESPLFIFDEYPENLIVYGNREYKVHTIPVFDRLMDDYEACMTEVCNVLEGYKDNYSNVTEAIMDYLPPEHKDKYSTKDIHAWKQLFAEWGKVWDRKSRLYESDCIVEALELMTGKKWACRSIHGSCQGDWNEVYYPVDEYSAEAINAFEVEYFNTGSEWMIHDAVEAPESPEDISGFTCYCVSWNEDDILQELANVAGCKPEEVKAWAWNGETYLPKYKEIA